MKAKIGDWLVTKGLTIDQHDHYGLITEVRSDDGSPPYVVHWVADDHVATVFPGPDAIVVTAEEKREMDARTARRIAEVQAGINHHSDTP